MKTEDVERILEEVISRVLQENIMKAFEGKLPLDRIINDTIYHERRRLESEKKTKLQKQETAYWRQVNRRLLNASEEEQKKILKEIIARFACEIVGHFNPKVYNFVTRAASGTVSALINLLSPGVWLSHFPHFADLSKLLLVRGEVDLLRSLAKIGTTVLVPTHSSNLDSIVVGLALYKSGLPPYTYGAGLNLFQSSPRIIRYFMYNLGAYKVDRKKKASLYKDVLKEYATLSIEFGYHNLFFPGGTRSRSGTMENKLKLGLLGTAVSAYINNLKQQKERPNIFVVPCTISYNLVLEAERLIEDFLQETGKSQYIIEDDEFSQPRRILNYLTHTLRLGSRIYLNIAPAMDLFGNRVDAQGVSYDKRMRPVDISRYVWVNGAVEHDEQRDQEYIRELGTEIQKAYNRYNVVMSVHLVAFTVYVMMVKHNPEMDIYRLLRTGGKEDNFPVRDVGATLERLLVQVKQLAAEGKIHVDEYLQGSDVNQILEDALGHFSVYHSKVVMFRRGDRIYPHDNNLIYYYHNRLQNYGLEKYI